MTPNRKMQAGGAAGLLSTVLVWALGQLGVELPVEVAMAIATLVFFVVGYFVPEKKENA